MRHDFFATTAKGLEEVLAQELSALGAERVVAGRAGVAFGGRLAVAYRACLWSRVASRILLPLATFRAETPVALYAGVRSINWADHVSPRGTIAVDCATSQSQLTHSHFAALKTKDAIVDQLRERAGVRPSIDVGRPDVRINVYLHRDRATVGIDLSGDSLHRRAYRARGTAAPLKENLAGGILLLAEWPRLAREGASFVDPMCGSGTLAIEAALIAADIAPGLRRPQFGFSRWRGHRAAEWHAIHDEAQERARRGAATRLAVHAADADGRTVRAAMINSDRAGLRDRIQIERRGLNEIAPPASAADVPGLFVVNPPYGERIGDREHLGALYADIGNVLRQRFTGWTGYVLTGNAELAKHIGLRATRRFVLYNGAIECRLLQFPISKTPVQKADGPRWRREPSGSEPV